MIPCFIRLAVKCIKYGFGMVASSENNSYSVVFLKLSIVPAKVSFSVNPIETLFSILFPIKVEIVYRLNSLNKAMCFRVEG